MNRRRIGGLAASLAVFALAMATGAFAIDLGSVQGVVKTKDGSPLAGAFVKLKNADKRLVFMVISQDGGKYNATGLPAGKYSVQGVGNGMQSDPASVDVAAGGSASADLSLTGKQPDLLPYAWPGRPPGEGGGEAETASAPLNLPEGDGKAVVLGKCSACHDAARIANAKYDKAGWEGMITDMRLYARGSNYAKDLTDAEAKALLDYCLTNFNSSRGGNKRATPDPNSRLPHTVMKGDAMKYRVVEFTLPNPKVEPHEITVDEKGIAWLTQRTGGRLGRFDPNTFEYKEINPPAAESDHVRLNGIVRAPDNKLWFLDGGPNRRWFNFDTKSSEFTTYPLPKLKSGSASGNTMRVHPDGTVWLNSISANEVIGLDPKTKKFSVYQVPSGVKAGKTANPYGMAIAGDGKIWFVENAMNKVGNLDPKTGKFEEYDIPVPNAVARKAGMDSEGNVWVGLHVPGKLMKVDYKTAKMTVYDPPTKDSGVYSVQGDPKSKLVWFSQQMADQIARFDPATTTFTEFPIPSAETDHRRIEIDPTNSSRIWFTGDLSGRIGYVELVR